MTEYIHATPTRNVPAILTQGLRPELADPIHRRENGEPKNFVFLVEDLTPRLSYALEFFTAWPDP